MALLQFYRGHYEKYDKTVHADGVFFASDKQLIIVNGVEYGGVNMHAFDGFIKDVDVEGQELTFKKAVENEWVDVNIKLIEAADSSIELGTITKDGVNDGSTIKLKAVYDTNADGDGLKLDETSGVKVVLDKTRDRLATIEGEDTVDGSIKKSLKDAKEYTDAEIQKLEVAEVGKAGQFIQSIKEENGKIAAVVADLVSTAVTRTATASSDTKVAVAGVNVEEAIDSLATSIKEVDDNVATYSIQKITGDTLDKNIREAYQLVKTKNGTDTLVDVQIPVYKDSSLKSVELVDEDGDGKKGQFLKFIYILEDGTESTQYLDVSTFLVEAEFKNGLDVNDAGEVSVKIDETSESFLSVSSLGVKIAGVQDAIDAAKEEIVSTASTEYNDLAKIENKIKEVESKASASHTQVIEKADGHVTVAVETKTDDSGVTHAEVTVGENDIASAQSLTDEIDRAKGAEDTIESSVGLAEDGTHVTTTGNYTSGATTVVGEISALDAQVKKISDNIADLTAADVAFSAITSGATTVAVDAQNVQDAVAALAKVMKAYENALTWIDVD